MGMTMKQEECLTFLDNILEKENIVEKQDALIEILTKELKNKNNINDYDVEVIDVILKYLDEHKKLLKDSVYPHLCSQLDKI